MELQLSCVAKKRSIGRDGAWREEEKRISQSRVKRKCEAVGYWLTAYCVWSSNGYSAAACVGRAAKWEAGVAALIESQLWRDKHDTQSIKDHAHK